jgi:hypothetical protein
MGLSFSLGTREAMSLGKLDDHLKKKKKNLVIQLVLSVIKNQS